MALEHDAIAKIWLGHKVLSEIANYAGDPGSARNADFMRQILYDTTNNDWYIHVGATIATQTWTKIAG